MLKIFSILLPVCFFLLFSNNFGWSTENQSTIPQQWTVKEAIRFALANNPDVKITRQRIAIASATIRQAQAAFYPQLDLSTQYSQTNTAMYSFGNILNQGVFDNTINFNDPGRTDNLNLSANLRYRFYNGGIDEAGLQAARANRTATQSELINVHTQLSFAVVHTFFSILQTEETLQARRSAVEAIESSLRVAQARHDAGDLLKADLLDIEVEKSKAGENLILARHKLNLTKREFRNLLGLENGETILQKTPKCILELPSESSSFDNHPQLLKIAAMILAAQEQIYSSEGGNLPTVDGFLTYQLDKGFENDGSGNSWAAGVKANYNIFNGSRTSARIAIAKARLSEILAIRKKTVLAINLKVERATLGLQQAEERLEVTRQMVSQALEGASLNRARFKEGVILTSDLINSENQLTDALLRRNMARTASWIATADLRRSYGLLQF